MNSLVFILVISVLGISTEPHRMSLNSTFADTVKEIVEERHNVSEDVVLMGAKVKDAMEEFMEESLDSSLDLTFSEDNATEFMGVDENGCNRGMRKDLEDRCDNEYDRVNEEAQQIENEREKTEAVCCALEDYEKCSLRAYDKANCITDKAAVRENLKAARLFLSVIGNITCSSFRGQCAFYNSGAPGFLTFKALLVSAVALVPLLL